MGPTAHRFGFLRANETSDRPGETRYARRMQHAVFGGRLARAGGVASLVLLVSCGGGELVTGPPQADTRGCEDGTKAPATCLSPRQAPEHYVTQSLRYFDTLDVSSQPSVAPEYAELVARWEWPPWLKLTGYGAQMMKDTATLVTTKDTSTVPTRDCRAFSVQPFGRCHVTIAYEGGPCAIYEEFTFNDQGEITFIEAWTDAPSSLPMDGATDPWAEGPGVRRLSTRVPGLGGATGRVDPAGPAMAAAAATDADVADFATRARDFWGTWFTELKENGQNIYARGCGW
jgi:hypothetical protein